MRKGLENGVLNLSWPNKTRNLIAQKGSRTSFFWIEPLPHWICVKQKSPLNNFLWKLKMNNIHRHYRLSPSGMSLLLISKISTLLFSFKIYLNRLFLVRTIYKPWTKQFLNIVHHISNEINSIHLVKYSRAFVFNLHTLIWCV